MTRSRTGRPSTAGLAMKVCLHFAAHPDARLSTAAIAEKFDYPQRGVGTLLSSSFKSGLLAKEVGGGHTHTVFMAGPALLDAIKPEDDEDRPVQTIRPAGTWERKTTGLAPAQWHEALVA